MEDTCPLTEERRKILERNLVNPSNSGQQVKTIKEFRKAFKSLYKYHDEMRKSRKRAHQPEFQSAHPQGVRYTGSRSRTNEPSFNRRTRRECDRASFVRVNL